MTSLNKINIISPFFVNGLILWQDVAMAYMYEQFTMMSEDYAGYSVVKFEAL